VIDLKSMLAGIAAVVATNILVVGILFFIVTVMRGYWGFAYSQAGLGTPAGALPAILIFAAGFYGEFRKISKPRASSR